MGKVLEAERELTEYLQTQAHWLQSVVVGWDL